MEQHLLAVMLGSRASYETIAQHITLNPNLSREKKYTREFGMLYSAISGYYERDPNADHVELPILRELLASESLNDKHVERLIQIADEASSMDTSEHNVLEVVLNMKRNEVALELAVAIQNGQEHTELAQQYAELVKASELEGVLEKGLDVYESTDIDDLLLGEDREGALAVYPLSINNRLDGGLIAGDHLTIFARPEMGKTAIVCTMATGFARQGAVGIVFNNEEAISRLRMRALSCATLMSRQEILNNPDAAKDIAEQVGYHNIIFVSMSPGSPEQIEALVERYEAKWFIVDQLRHLTSKSGSKVEALEENANAMRKIAKKQKAVAITITQAGDSGDGKAILDMGDVDFSNTGIPGACDVLLGIGATEDQKASGIRVISLSKNKIGGEHAHFPVRLNPLISKYVSMESGD